MPLRSGRRGTAVAALPAARGGSPPHKKPRASAGRASWPLVATFALVCCVGAAFSIALLAATSPNEGNHIALPAAEIVVNYSAVAAVAADADAPVAVAPLVPTAEDLPPSADECFAHRDYGLVSELRASTRLFCSAPAAAAAPAPAPVPAPAPRHGGGNEWRTSYAFLRSEEGGLQATVFRGLRLDLRSAEVAHDIQELSQDGGDHDPRLVFDSVRPLCACAADAPRQDAAHGAPRVWSAMLAKEPASPSAARSGRRAAPRLRGDSDVDARYLVCDSNATAEEAVAARVFPDDVNVIVMARKDDHNPFFQVSAALNAWLMLRVLNWSADSTQLVYLDRGIASPVDELQRLLIAPRRPALSSGVLFGPEASSRTVHFGSALLAPFEATGPLMRHLNDKEPCARSQLVRDFRAAALAAMGVDGHRVSPNKPAGQCLVTVISRRTYGGRRVQRMWTNEAEVLKRMRADYGDRCEFQSLDFAELSMAQQMRVMVDSDVVIGMHGAGMVNVMWTRPQTLVVEIFPKRRFRWGFRNICQHVGCDWHEFRGGRDVMPPATVSAGNGGRRVRASSDPNALDKSVTPSEWAKFAYPLIDAVVAQISLVAKP